MIYKMHTAVSTRLQTSSAGRVTPLRPTTNQTRRRTNTTTTRTAAAPADASGQYPASKPAFPPGVGFSLADDEAEFPANSSYETESPQPLLKGALVARLLAAKEASGKSFSQIAAEVGLTNVYCTQLFYNQQQLQPNTAAALQSAVPALSDDDIAAMMRAPMRSFEPNCIQEPSIYRLYEAIMHNGEAIKAVINEEFGDGIMSAIDFYCTVDKMEGTQGERRVVITFNGKFLPFVEQRITDNVAQRPPQQQGTKQ